MNSYLYEQLEYLTESDLLEASSKTDFRDKFGQKALDNFDKAKQRLKNNNLSTDYGQYLKMSEDELNNLLLSLYDDSKDAQKKRIIQGKEKEIRGSYKHYGIIDGYDVYEPLDYIASMDLGVNTGWCTTGRYGHAGHPEFTPSEKDAKKHFDEYVNNDIQLIYLLDPSTHYGKIAIAIYPEMQDVNRYIGGKHVYSANAEIFTAEDNLDYGLLTQIPSKILDMFEIDIVDSTSITSIHADDIESISLLSYDESRELPRKILVIDKNWWLSTPANDSTTKAMCISFDGEYCSRPCYISMYIRPVLKVSEESLESVKYRDMVQCFGRLWYCIAKDKIIAKDPISKAIFDKKGNRYTGSSIDLDLRAWLRDKKASDNGRG